MMGIQSKKLKLSGILWWPLFILIGCLSPIEIDVDREGGLLVVTGQVSTISDQNIIQLGRTSEDERLPFPVSGASIYLYDNTGNSFFYTEDLDLPGTYILNNVQGIEGRTYDIQITLPDGESYRSKPETLPQSTIIESVYYTAVTEDIVDAEGAFVTRDFVKVYANSTIPPSDEPVYIKWGVEETFVLSPTDFPDPFGSIPPPCYISQNADPQRIPLFNGAELHTNEINDLLVANRNYDWTFLERHHFTTYQSSLTPEAYEYWRKVNILANQVGSIFDTPPAFIVGNLTNENDPEEKVLGYFQATNQSFKRFFVEPFDFTSFGSASIKKCTFTGSFNPNDYPSRCINCRSVKNSSYTRPPWF